MTSEELLALTKKVKEGTATEETRLLAIREANAILKKT